MAGEWLPELELGLPEVFSGVEAGLGDSGVSRLEGLVQKHPWAKLKSDSWSRCPQLTSVFLGVK